MANNLPYASMIRANSNCTMRLFPGHATQVAHVHVYSDRYYVRDITQYVSCKLKKWAIICYPNAYSSSTDLILQAWPPRKPV